VQIPVYYTGFMNYVDLGWPLGLVLMSVYGWFTADGYWPRVGFSCFAYFMIGLRMAAGGLYAMYPYKFKEDFGRYKYAKAKWCRENPQDGQSTWWIKQQQDTFTQCIANMFTLPMP
jgi:hypothetical protein